MTLNIIIIGVGDFVAILALAILVFIRKPVEVLKVKIELSGKIRKIILVVGFASFLLALLVAIATKLGINLS